MMRSGAQDRALFGGRSPREPQFSAEYRIRGERFPFSFPFSNSLFAQRLMGRGRHKRTEAKSCQLRPIDDGHTSTVNQVGSMRGKRTRRHQERGLSVVPGQDVSFEVNSFDPRISAAHNEASAENMTHLL